jgi:hypothetical protein
MALRVMVPLDPLPHHDLLPVANVPPDQAIKVVVGLVAGDVDSDSVTLPVNSQPSARAAAWSAVGIEDCGGVLETPMGCPSSKFGVLLAQPLEAT